VKKLVAIVKPFKLDDVVRAVQALGVSGLTLSEARGFGRQKGHADLYRGAEAVIELVPKLRLEIAVCDELAVKTARVLAKAARTGRVGDGKVFIEPLEGALRIRTGERGDAALR
jgi:nitrogen regulatory protein P-II 1